MSRSSAGHVGSPMKTASIDAQVGGGISNANNTIVTGNPQGRSSVEDPESLLRARQNYHDLQDLLNSLGAKLTNVSTHVDAEFLSSYRVHMLQIQSEMRHLKQEVTKSEQRLNDDVQVARLETEAKWFMEECTRLRNHYDAMKSDCEQMKYRLKGMQEQKEYLGAQLKALVKRNRVLQDSINEIKGVTNALDAKFLKQRRQKLPRSVLVPGDNHSHGEAQGAAFKDLSDEDLAGNVSRDHPSQLQQRQLKNAHSQPLLSRGRKSFNRHATSAPFFEDYKEQLKDERDDRSLIEEELEESIRSIFQEVQMRRLLSLHKSSTRLPTVTSTSRPGSPQRAPSSPHATRTTGVSNEDPHHTTQYDDHHVVLPTLIKQAGGISLLGTEQFSDHDKFATVVNFLSKPAVLEEVIKSLKLIESEEVDMYGN
eukprot:gene37933-46085_t